MEVTVEQLKQDQRMYSWLRKIYPTLTDADKEEARQIFPGVLESEDERIREAIESIIRVYGKTQGEWIAGYDMGTLVVHLREAFGALERQKEQQPDFIVPKRIRPKFAVGDTVCRPMWSDHTIREMYIDCDDPVYICVNEEGTESHISFSEQDEWERKEQKPAGWSEEDEDTYNRVYCLFRDAIDEWYKVIFSGCYPKITRDKVLAMLKSFRPQPHWKPSKDEMTAIEVAVKCLLAHTSDERLHANVISAFKHLKLL